MSLQSPGVVEAFSLKDRVVVVTGGAGLYGRQIVRAVAGAGATTVMASRDLDALKREAVRFRDEDSVVVHPYPLDQGEESSVLALRDQLLADFGHVDVLVNNAVLRTMRNWQSSAADFARSMAVNATGLFVITRAFGDAMATNGRGSIINVASIQGTVGPDLQLYKGTDMGAPPDYFFHKGGMLQLTRYAASHYGRKGVRVNTVSPGGYYNGQNAEFVERYNDRTLLGRMATDTDLGGAIVFLASDASAYITGANIAIDGGYTTI
jgi:NAD(P)-dependent dehydrogenase (short-subunit alcohol dehydrogenase family)